MQDVSKFINFCPKICIIVSNFFFLDFDGEKNILGMNEHFSYWNMGLILIQEAI